MDERDRLSAKQDRLARFYRVLRHLQAHPEGVRVADVARAVGVSRRTAYRDLEDLDLELGLPVWNEAGRWGVDPSAYLPPLSFTLHEAMAVFLSARLMAKFADEYDPELAGAFQKLAAVLPATLGQHVARTLDVMARRPVDERLLRHVHLLTRAWAERLVVSLAYDAGTYDPSRAIRTARVRPYLIEPSASTHALYLIGWDEERGAVRTYRVERIRDVALTPERFEPPADGILEAQLERAWGIIADQGEVEVAVRFSPRVAARVLETTWHPSQRIETAGDGSLTWRATVSGIVEVRLWILGWGADAEVLAPPELRDDIAATYRAGSKLYGSG